MKLPTGYTVRGNLFRIALVVVDLLLELTHPGAKEGKVGRLCPAEPARRELARPSDCGQLVYPQGDAPSDAPSIKGGKSLSERSGGRLRPHDLTDVRAGGVDIFGKQGERIGGIAAGDPELVGD